MATSPKVSIIIPVYNGSNFLSQAIQSALAQSYDNIEVVVINDGSTDGGKSEEIALSYGERIRYFKKENGGAASALNFGISKMSGEYFSWLSHDDLYTQEKISRQIEAISSTHKVAVGDFDYIDTAGKRLGSCKLTQREADNIQAVLAMEPEVTINGCTLLIPREFFDRYGLFEPQLKTAQDYDMWFRIGEHEQFQLVSGSYVKCRLHPEQDSKKIADLAANEADRVHAEMVKKLSHKKFDAYIQNDRELKEKIQIYELSGFPKTAAELILKRLNSDDGKFTKYVESRYHTESAKGELREVLIRALTEAHANSTIEKLKRYGFPFLFKTALKRCRSFGIGDLMARVKKYVGIK